MSVKYSSIDASKDLSNIDDLVDSFDTSVNKAIDLIILNNINIKESLSSPLTLWTIQGPLLSDMDCLKHVDNVINAHRYYNCMGCKVLHQLDFTTPEKAYNVEFGNMQGYKVYLKLTKLVSQLVEIKDNGIELNKILTDTIGNCDLEYKGPKTMVGLDDFTNNVLISHILSQKVKYTIPTHFAYLCNGKGYILTDEYIPIDKYIKNNSHHVENLFGQLISFYKECRAHHYHFIHGKPSLNALMIDVTEKDPILKIGGFEKSSITYKKSDNIVRFHPAEEMPDVNKVRSTLKFNYDNNTYKMMYNNKNLINKLHCVGIPIFNESYDIYHFILHLSQLKDFNEYFIKASIYDAIFDPNDVTYFIKNHKMDNPLIGLNLYCNVLDRV